MEYKSYESYVIKLNDTERTIEAIGAVNGNIDDGNDRIWNGAFTKTIAERAARVKYLWQHDATQPPVGTILGMEEMSKSKLPSELRQKYPEATGALKATVRYLDTPRGNEILSGVKEGAINEHSIGYDPIKFDYESDSKSGSLVRNLREVRLWDISPVNWGMNPATMVMKAAMPFQDTGKAPEGDSWSAPTLGDFTDSDWSELSDAEKMRIARHYAYSANTPPESFGDLKLPHHQPGKDGVGPAVWRGVAAAMAALLGARGGVDVGDAKQAVYNHLARHYRQFDKEPPEYKLLEFVALSGELEPALVKSGRVLSAANSQRLKDALAVLQELLTLAEPLQAAPAEEPGQKALTNKRVLQRLEIALHDLNNYGG